MQVETIKKTHEGRIPGENLRRREEMNTFGGEIYVTVFDKNNIYLGTEIKYPGKSWKHILPDEV